MTEKLQKRIAELEIVVLDKGDELQELRVRVAEIERFAVTIGALLAEDDPDDDDRERWMSAHQKARERRKRERGN